MAKKRNPRKVQFIRLSDAFFDVLGLRPIGIAVFTSSTALFFYLIGLSSGAIQADGVAVAGRVDHPSPVASFVTRTFVRTGDRVEEGTPLVELSATFIDRDLSRVDLQIDQLIAKSKLALAKSTSRERAKRGANAWGSEETSGMAELTTIRYEKEIEVKRRRREKLISDREGLVVKASHAGIVSQIAWLGASISERMSVASVMPEFAEEIVAYVSPDVDASSIATGVATYMVGMRSIECAAPGLVRNRGAQVEEAPGQLRRLLGQPVHGMPVHITIPSGCRLVNGQVLALNFRNEVQ